MSKISDNRRIRNHTNAIHTVACVAGISVEQVNEGLEGRFERTEGARRSVGRRHERALHTVALLGGMSFDAVLRAFTSGGEAGRDVTDQQAA